MQWFDAGVNLTNARFVEQLEQTIADATQAGVVRMVVIGTDLEHSNAALKLCEQFPHYLQATVGIHPHDAGRAPADFVARLRHLSQHPSVCAIGECGLDFNRNFSSQADQLRVFAAQLELAAERQLPVYLHERDALTEQIQLLSHYRTAIPRLFTHCFTGGLEQLRAYQQLDCYIGVTGWVCDERRGQELQQAVPWIAADRLILETDAPYLVPRTIRPRPRSNAPKLLPAIAEQVARLRRQSVAELTTQVWENSLRLFANAG